ncbi:hypothetical protein JCM10908_005445 [Rhodotorula pacifica]|uniref:uncharacterized protein n=1 Tax=Rhodotorula pacifica TaxID=1495444 RepID=UPI0031799B6F
MSTGVGQSRAPGKSGRLARSKAACGECHKAKQRCDGPPGPCHRCKTWDIECIFPSTAGPTPSTSTLSRASTPDTRTTRARGATPSQSAAVASTSANVAVATATPDVAEQLRIMNARLESLETALARATPATTVTVSTAETNSSPRFHHLRTQSTLDSAPRATSASSAISPHGFPAVPETQHDGVGVNAVETAGEAMAVEGLVDLGGGASSKSRNGHQSASASTAQANIWEEVRPDVISKGILTYEECDAEFEFFFQNIQPWAGLLSTSLDRDPRQVRERSPLLFHAILLLTLYYRERTPVNLQLYRAVSTILDSILAPQILCPQPDQLSFDFVRAVQLLILYKPVQYSALNARGVSDASQIESASKMNVRASWVLRLLVSRVSAFVGLPSIANAFAQAFANQHLSPIPEEIISQQRLYLGCVFHESHGAIQSGKSANFVPQEACKTTRLFATLKRQPSDVRLAASVELVALAANALQSRTEAGILDADGLRRFDDEFEAWMEYWAPLVSVSSEESGGEDPIAWSLFVPYACFTRLTVRGFAFNKWRAERKARLVAIRRGELEGVKGEPAQLLHAHLENEDRDSIAKAVEVVEEMMLAVSTQGRGLRSDFGRRKGEKLPWRGDGAALTPDPDVVKTLKWSSDSLTCVMFSYPLIFLAKLVNDGLLPSDLTVIAAGSPLLPPAPMSHDDKLCRLFQLGATLLDAIAPSPHHPAVRQAAFLRKVWDAGISGRRAITSAPSSPRVGPLAGHSDVPPLHPQALAQQLQNAASECRTPHQPLLAANPSASMSINHITSAAPPSLSAYNDLALSSSYAPTPSRSPSAANTPSSYPSHRALMAAGMLDGNTLLAASDPFSALLSELNPSIVGDDTFFGLDSGLDWPVLDGSGADSGGANGFSGMQF